MNQRIKFERHESGFTLFELLIVIVILAILAVIVAFSVGTSRANALSSSCQSDAKTFASALEEYKAQVGVYPGLGNGSAGPTGTTGEYGLLGNNGADWTLNGQTFGPFLRSLPSSAHYQIVTDGAGGVFVYPPSPPGMSALQLSESSQAFIDTMSPDSLLGITTDPNTKSFNFDSSNGAICNDPNVVQ